MDPLPAFFFGVCLGIIIMRGLAYGVMRDRQRVLKQRDALQAQVDALVTHAATRPCCIREEL